MTNRESRTKAPVPLAAAIASAEIVNWSPDDDAYWNARDAEVAALRVADEDKAKRERDAIRAEALLIAEFPEVAVSHARAVEDTLAVDWSRKYLGSPKRMLVLAGGVGSGKTTAATWIAMQLSNAAMFVRAAELEARGRYDQDLRRAIGAASLLVIDDLGAETLDGKGVFRGFFDEIADKFYSGSRRRIVITTNLRVRRDETNRAPQIAERYGERMLSRLREFGMLGDCGSEDLRRRRKP